MEAVIKRILDMDRQAQEMTAAATQEKLEAEQDIAAKVQTLRDNYLRQTQNRIRMNAENDRTIMEQEWKKRQQHYDEQRQRLQAAYAESADAWVETLTERILADTP